MRRHFTTFSERQQGGAALPGQVNNDSASGAFRYSLHGRATRRPSSEQVSWGLSSAGYLRGPLTT